MYTSLALILIILVSLGHPLNISRNHSFILSTKSPPSSVQITRAINRPTKTCRTGAIVEFRGGTTFLVKLDSSNKTVLCDLSGRCIKRRIRVEVDTKVKVEFDLLHPSRGRIVERINVKAKKEKKEEEYEEEEFDEYDEEDS